MYYMTSGREFYERLCRAREAQDLAALSALYHSDAVSLSVPTGQVFRGRGAIVDAFNHTFQIAGAISSRSVESMVEAEGSVCVEATLATRSGEMQTYDIYLLQAGICAQHVGGLISPRPPIGRGSVYGLPQTKGAALYHQYRTAMEAQDVAQLSSLYHPDMVSVDCITNQSWRGRAAILSRFQQVIANGGSVSLNSVERFVESSEIICAEITTTTRYISRMGNMQVDALTYEVLVLHAGRIVQRFGGAISPRGQKLLQTIEQQNELLFKVGMGRLHQIQEAFQNSLYPRRRHWW
jgi:ketosteroid isomerase-like protein